MLIKVIRGCDSGALCRYVLDPKKQKAQERNTIEETGIVSSVVFCTTIPGRTIEQLASNLQLFAQLNARVQKTVAHYSISLHPDEANQVERSQMAAISRAMLDELGHSRCPYFGVEHHDADQKHWHLVTSTVGYDGKWVDDSFDRNRLRILRRAVSTEDSTSPAAKEKRLEQQKAFTTGEYRQKARTGEVLPKEKLWTAIDSCIEQGMSTERFVLSLRAKHPEISVQFREEGSQKVGISFGIDGAAFAGRKLGRTYSLQGLKAHYGVEITAVSSLDKVLALTSEQCQKIYLDLENNSVPVNLSVGFEL